MPHYSTNYNNPSLTQDNIASRQQFKNLNRNTTGQGKYPTDQIMGTGTLANRTQSKADLDSAIALLTGEISAYQTTIATLTTGEAKYFTQRNGLNINHLMEAITRASDLVQNLRLEAAKVHSAGVPATGRYPSGYNRGW